MRRLSGAETSGRINAHRKAEQLGQAGYQALGHQLEPEVVGIGSVHQAVAPRRSQQVRTLDDFDVAVAGRDASGASRRINSRIPSSRASHDQDSCAA